MAKTRRLPFDRHAGRLGGLRAHEAPHFAAVPEGPKRCADGAESRDHNYSKRTAFALSLRLVEGLAGAAGDVWKTPAPREVTE